MSPEGEKVNEPKLRVALGERTVLASIAVIVAGAVGFIVVYAISADTQLMGLCLGVAFCALAVALVVASRTLVPQKESVEERPAFGDEEAESELTEEIEGPVEGITRRKAIVTGAGAAGVALGAAAVTPLLSLGPAPGDEIGASPWSEGTLVVDGDGRTLTPNDIPIGSFVTGFPQGADKRLMGSPIVIVKLPQDQLDLPDDRQDWAPEGVLAYSKICVHAGCAINLYRYPLYSPTSPGPALICPCHYSTFDPATGGNRIFGPAGRPLPQLPLALDSEGRLMANGGFSAGVGPSWSGTLDT